MGRTEDSSRWCLGIGFEGSQALNEQEMHGSGELRCQRWPEGRPREGEARKKHRAQKEQQAMGSMCQSQFGHFMLCDLEQPLGLGFL